MCTTAVCEQGKVEAELNLVSAEEKELNPVGMGRKEPEPLPDPKYVCSIMLAVILDKTIHFAALCVILYVAHFQIIQEICISRVCKLDLRSHFFRSVLLEIFHCM